MTNKLMKKISAILLSISIAFSVPVLAFAYSSYSMDDDFFSVFGFQIEESEVDEFLADLENVLEEAGIFVDIERTGDYGGGEYNNDDSYNDQDDNNDDYDNDNYREDDDRHNDYNDNKDYDGEIDPDDFISTVEGHPFYGMITDSLTVRGDTSPGSALALGRFPVADGDGDFYYERIIEVSDEVIEALRDGKVVIVQHGIDINESGAYDGELSSELDPNVPFEATVPASCGVIEYTNGRGLYGRLEPLNTRESNAYADVWIEIISERKNTVKVMIDAQSLAPNLAHAQHFHLGNQNTCPPPSAANDSDRSDMNEMSHDGGDNHSSYDDSYDDNHNDDYNDEGKHEENRHDDEFGNGYNDFEQSSDYDPWGRESDYNYSDGGYEGNDNPWDTEFWNEFFSNSYWN